MLSSAHCYTSQQSSGEDRPGGRPGFLLQRGAPTIAGCLAQKVDAETMRPSGDHAAQAISLNLFPGAFCIWCRPEPRPRLSDSCGTEHELITTVLICPHSSLGRLWSGDPSAASTFTGRVSFRRSSHPRSPRRDRHIHWSSTCI